MVSKFQQAGPTDNRAGLAKGQHEQAVYPVDAAMTEGNPEGTRGAPSPSPWCGTLASRALQGGTARQPARHNMNN